MTSLSVSLWLLGLSTWRTLHGLRLRKHSNNVSARARYKKHGPHLPLNNDWIMAEYLTGRVAEQGIAIILPTLQYDYYPSLTEYPVSVTLGLDTSR